MIGGFGQSGQAQSQQFAWQACTICNAPIRVSYFLVGFFGFQLLSLCRQGFDMWAVLFLCGQEAILIATVLCHEFGHGTAARSCGGEIDHILLWPFGGICFSSRPRGVTDPRALLRCELKIVAAGPATHFIMTPFWCLLLYFFGLSVAPRCVPNNCASCTGIYCVLEYLNPLGSGPYPYSSMGQLASTVWDLLGVGIRMNVSLFLFNVLFPMYPADGAKLLTTGLMQCFGVSPRRAALVLIVLSSIASVLLLLYGVRIWYHGQGQSAMMVAGLMGMMAVMSMVETYRIYKLREDRKLHTHALFRTARSEVATHRDDYGRVSRLTQGSFDDPEADEGGVQCYLCSGADTSAEESEEWQPPAATAVDARDPQRGRRDGILNRIESDQAQRGKTVRQLEEERLAMAAAGQR